jgi:hypothetical protein
LVLRHRGIPGLNIETWDTHYGLNGQDRQDVRLLSTIEHKILLGAWAASGLVRTSFGSSVLNQFAKDCLKLFSAISKSHAKNLHQSVLVDSLMVESAIQEKIKAAIFSLDYFYDGPGPLF